MSLSSELISQFAKITKDKEEVKKETTVYGTIVNYNGSTYVKLDGSDLLTPISTTTETQSGERVTVMIKDHTATVTGNMSSPAARTDDVKELGTKISEFDAVVANKVSAEQLDAQVARINTLTADNVTIKEKLTANEAVINNLDATYAKIDKLNAANAEIQNLKTTKLNVDIADAKYATISELDATKAQIDDLDATYATIESLDVTKAEIKNLDSKYATIDNLNATNAEIDELEAKSLTADSAVIKDLEADVAKVDTLIFGAASGDSIQTSFANAVIAQLGDAQIKSAMIDNVSANKIQSGSIDTTTVTVTSEDGKLLIADETIQIKDANRTRVQIGKDASGDYSINVWDADGKLMFSEGGLTEDAIKDSIIRDDMVSDTANIDAKKLNISSLFTVLNEDGTNTLKSSKIAMDSEGQTLDVAFTNMTSDMDDLNKTVSSQGTSISVMQGQIASKVWQQDIDDAKGEMSTQYSSLEQTVNGINATVASHTTQIQNKADSSQVTAVNNKVASLESNLEGFQSTVSETYATKTELDSIDIGGRNLLQNSKTFYVHGAATGITGSVTEDGHLQIIAESGNQNWISVRLGTNYTNVEDELSDGDEFVISFMMRSPDSTYAPSIYIKPGLGYYNLKGTLSSEWSQVWYAGVWKESSGIQPNFGLGDLVGTYEVKSCKIEKGNRPTDWTPAPEDIDDKIGAVDERLVSAQTKIDQNTEKISLAATKTEVTNQLSGYYTKSQTDAAITAKADAISSSVKETYATKTDVDSIEVGGRNLIPVGSISSARGVTSTKNFILNDAWASSFVANSELIKLLNPSTEYTVKYDLTLIGRTSVPTPFDMMCGFLIYSPTKGTWISLATNLTEHATAGTTRTVERTFTTPSTWNDESIICYSRKWTTEGSDPVGFDTFQVKNFKIEKGNKATDWTPAPEDVDADIDGLEKTFSSSYSNYDERITVAESLINQLSHTISMLVRDSNGQSQMTQTSTEVEYAFFSTEEIDKAIEDTSATLDALNTEYGDTKATVDVLKQTLANYEERVKFSTYEDEPCIILYEGDSNYKQIITNTRRIIVETIDNVDTIRSIADYESVRTKRVIATESVQVGGYVLKTLANGSTVFTWEGVTE